MLHVGFGMADRGKIKNIKIDQLELDLSNPRHTPFKRPSQAIEYLVLKERVVDLAVDIAKEGTNPMDLLGVFKKKGTGCDEVYVAAEGNRRVCALMLLHDPEKIPAGVTGRAKLIARLEAAAKSAHISPTIDVIVFKSKKVAKPWVDRMHIQDGRSRRRWTPDQQERAMGGGRNKDAAALLDIALAKGMIEEVDRSSKLTTVQRYLGNPTMRKALGIVRDQSRNYYVDRKISDFALLLGEFLDDVRKDRLSSRSDAAAVIRYSDALLEQTGVGNERVSRIPLEVAIDEVIRQNQSNLDNDDETESNKDEDEDFGQDSDDQDDQENDDHEPIRPRLKIGGTPELETAFARSKIQKLQALYSSCTSLPLRHHCPLITVGFWSILETLAALHGGEGSKFADYFSHDRLNNEFGFQGREERKNIIRSLKHITERGNSTKHSAIAASFDGNQLANDFDVLTPLMIAVLRSLPSRKESGTV